MTFIRGVGSPVHGHTSGNSIDKYFGPFNVGPGLQDGGAGEMREEGWDDYTDV